MRIPLVGFKEFLNVDVARDRLLSKAKLKPDPQTIGIIEASGRVAF